ncbi:Uncharacterized protein TCAP_05200 [Tolypocladium capitatum]|uniref:Kinetochore protein mis14 n=1 Tax=Tolypocladium capitatum TaxID=45235 RepID=A0A2K3QBF6_9HYPO|nr:Uncharacterized protein TCAP_05200 [Tolypocladium capitatum]
MDSESVVSQVQRKIELQSPEDLAYLVANVRTAAAARLDEAFPHVEGHDGREDELRTRIEALVNQYIDRTFALAAPNLSINGLPVSGAHIRSSSSAEEPAYEPFDARKRIRIAELVTAEEKLLEDVAALKRSIPAAAAAAHAARLRDAMQRDEDALQQRVARVTAAAGDGDDAAKLGGVAPLDRQDGVEAGFRAAVDALGRLKRDMPAIVAKMERARVAGEYVVTEGR